MLPDAAGGHEQGHDDDASAEVRIGHRLIVWYWRFRVVVAVVPFAWLVMGEAPPLLVFLSGGATFIAAWLTASRFASMEVRARRSRAARERR